MPWRRSFEGFVEATREVRTVGALTHRLLECLLDRGFNHVNFTVHYDQRVPETYRGFGIINTYPQSWQDHYNDRQLHRLDPVAQRAWSIYEPFLWRDLERSDRVPRRGKGFLREADDAGLHGGIGIPFDGPKSQIAGIAMASSDRRLIKPSELDILASHCNHFYKIYCRLIGAVVDGPPSVVLTIKESQVMGRVAYGLSNKEIAIALNMSPAMVDCHLRSVFEKLNVHDRGLAALICLQLGLIEISF